MTLRYWAGSGSRLKTKSPARGPGSSLLWRNGTVLCGFLGRHAVFRLGVAVGVLGEEGLDLLDRHVVVDLLHRGDLARHALERLLEKLAFGIGLLGLALGAVEVAHDLGHRNEVAGIDLRFIFLGAARPH